MVDIGLYGRESDGGISRTVFLVPEFTALLNSHSLKPARHQHETAICVPVRCCVSTACEPGVNLDNACKVYYYRHSRARRVIENTFGILAVRWRILGRPMEFQPEKAVDVVKACVTLHNM
ncbi:hypothetical protein R3I93_017490 [Phoxinus phoxinus]|uniref:DDE Tnp4 domain-containing protein n=1 Tax=Phoxinus phoxinus TaxID=58324 RepID=A0AAN9CI29_9TELE